MKDRTSGPWEFAIDRGGTFTDCIGLGPNGRTWVHKCLSSDTAPLDGIRAILERAGELESGAELPLCVVKLGSTVATNALLERKGAATVWVANRGLGDLLTIGTQERPDLFRLQIRKPVPLHEEVVECTQRTAADGDCVEELDETDLRRELRAAHRRGMESLAVCLIHSYLDPEPERRVARIAREVGFGHVVCSHEIARELGLLARAETSVADAYLTPLLRRHVMRLEQALPGSTLRFMQSSGGLTQSERFRGPNALLSGPAGGVVAAARVAGRAGFQKAIGFDMGGTSTDVSLIVDGEVERSFETEVGGVRVRAPMLRIHTVAAGGGSLCRFDGFRLSVGPESAGSDPGPLCYGLENESGGLLAHELTLTDVNLVLGRVQRDRFPFPVSEVRPKEALDAMAARVQAAGFELDSDALAGGFVEIANASMAQAIAQVSVARGVDPRGHVLVGFGGAGGQHVCGIARILGIETILLHPLAGLLSAYGIGVADISWDGQGDAGRTELPERGLPSPVSELFLELEAEGEAALRKESQSSSPIHFERALDLRYRGTESALTIHWSGIGEPDWRPSFEAEHQRRFGYTRPERVVEIVTGRVRAVLGASVGMDSDPVAGDASSALRPVRHASVYFQHRGRLETPVYLREDLPPGTHLQGPALILEATGSVTMDPGFELQVDSDGVLRIRDRGAAMARSSASDRDLGQADPVRLEVFGNRFMSMAEQMGSVLRNTAFSTNIKERLDYSCAVFAGDGGLVANAPHIPVHLGAMGATVRTVIERFPDLATGDVVVTNDPFAGGSHLPDVTVVTPVFLPGSEEAAFFVASRGHHADLGGVTPGSMPPDSTRLEQEGVVISPFRLVRGGRFDEAKIRELLNDAPFPARRPDDNVADLEAMVAANRAGERLLKSFVREQGRQVVAVTMDQLQRASAQKVAREIEKLPDGDHLFEDRMDDGTPIRVRVQVRGEQMDVDFSGTGDAVAHNLNAPPAVVQAALIYFLRSLVEETIPLNGGCLKPVRLRIPAGSLLDPPPGSAVVGGNVETSQRVVDVLFGALGRAAASQGTMNNVTFGNDRFGYYETIGGGAGAGPGYEGASGVHTHMTNTRITDPEVLEVRYPVRLERFCLRRESGGAGMYCGGDGLVREYRFLESVTVSLLTERRRLAPWGLEGGDPGRPGRNRVLRRGGQWQIVPGRCRCELQAGDHLCIETPGGGGLGRPE